MNSKKVNKFARKTKRNRKTKARTARVTRRPVRTQGRLPITIQNIDYLTELQYSQQYGFTFSPTRTELDIKAILLGSQEYQLIKKSMLNLRIRWVTVVITVRDGIYTGLHPPRLAIYGDNYEITDAMIMLNSQYPTVYVNSPKTQRYRFNIKQDMLTNDYRGYVKPEDPTPIKLKIVTPSVVPVTQPLPNIATVRVSINLSYHKVDNIEPQTRMVEPISRIPQEEEEESGDEDFLQEVADSKGPKEPSGVEDTKEQNEPDAKDESAKIDASTNKKVQILLNTIRKLKLEIDELRSNPKQEPSQ